MNLKLRTERVRPQSRAYVDRSFSFLASSCSANKTTFKLATQDDLHVPITVLSALTASFFHSSFPLYLSSHSPEQHLRTPRHYHAAAVRSFLYLILVLPLCVYTSIFILHHWHPRGCRYDTKLDMTVVTDSAHVYKITLLLVEEGIFDRSSFFNQAVHPSISLSTHLHACLSR